MAGPMIHDFTGRSEGAGGAQNRARRQLEGVEGGQPPSFGDLVRDFGNDVNRLKKDAGAAVDSFVSGQTSDVHQVMVAMQKAGVAMDLMLEIRNRLLEGYQELIRMQV